MPRLAIAILASILMPALSYAGNHVDSSSDSLHFTYGLRFGFGEKPGYYSNVETVLSDAGARFFGGQIALYHGDHFYIGVGFERMFSAFPDLVLDSQYSDSGLDPEDAHLNASYLYLTLGAETRMGNVQPLSIGAAVDIGNMRMAGLLQIKEGVLELDDQIRAIRPKVELSYSVWRKMRLHMEWGWMFAARHQVAGGGGFENSAKGRDLPEDRIDFSGPYFAAMLSVAGPAMGRRKH